MRFGLEPINDIIDKIVKKEMVYEDTVIIGDNSSGKSFLLNLLIRRSNEINDVYFIDAVNRFFDVTKVIQKSQKPDYKPTILKTRMQEDYFNLKDSFNCYGTMTERIEELYFVYEEELQRLFFELTKDRFRILYGNTAGEVEFEEGCGLLSSGYQAMTRLVLELLYFQEMGIREKGKTRGLVIIDEIDEFLSPRYAAAIWKFLKKNFPLIDIVATTHSGDLVMGANNANLVILNEDGYEVADINDYNSISEVQIIFYRIFGKPLAAENEIENILRRLLNNKINSAWSGKDEKDFRKLKNMKLTASQQLVYRQIQKW